MSRVWVVTGASGGLGGAIAGEVLARGDRLVALVRRPEAAAGLIGADPERVRTVEFEATQPMSVEAAGAEAIGAFGRVDVLVNNAGYALLGALEELDGGAVRGNFEACFFAPMNLMRAVLPGMRERGSGHIINISAAAAIINYPGFGAYGAAKCALEGLSEAVAQEAGPLGVRVTIVQPGPFRTGFVSRSVVRAERTIAEYEGTSGKFGALIRKLDGQQPGDPVKAAKAIVDLANAEKPPLRLALGKYAVNKVRKRLRETGAELEAWESVSSGADF
ncbi:MAG: SDR family NAD(P)-dependent oxidoreductase [Phycisphaerales bacterium]